MDVRHSSSACPFRFASSVRPISIPYSNIDDHGCSILSKLKAETNQLTGVAKKTTVDTHRGDTYQFCYFIRKTEQHSVAIKSRNFRAISQQEQKRYIPTSKEPSSKSRGKRKEVTADDALPSAAAKRKKRKTHKAAARSKPTNADVVDVDMDDLSANDEFEQLQTGVDSAEMGAAQMDATTVIDLEVDSEEEKPKPILNLTYQGFNIYGHCLCVVVEPWPVIRSMTTTSLSNRSAAGSSLVQQRTRDERSPLFFPEESQEDEESIEISDGDSEIGGMMEFSQALRNVGDSRAGAANDDEGMDGSVLFGDADEFKEL